MKKILLLFSVLLSFACSFAQNQPYVTSFNYGNAWQRSSSYLSMILPFQDTTTSLSDSATKRPGSIVVGTSDSDLYYFNGKAWMRADTKFTGGQITAIPTVGQTINSKNIQDWLTQAFYPSQVPTSTLTMTYGGNTSSALQVELIATSTLELPVTLNWTGGRQSKTQPLSSIVVAGISQTFSQPSAGSSASGTQADSVVRNTTTTFTNVVTTTDSKTASSSASITFLPKRYWGSTINVTPTNGEILIAAGGGSELSASKTKSNFTVVIGSTSSAVFYTYPSSEGTLSSIIIGGFESIGAFTLVVTSVTNASGYVQNYNVYTSNNKFASTTITFTSVN